MRWTKTIDKSSFRNKRNGNPNNKFGKLDVIIFIILLIYALMVIFPFYYAFTVSVSSENAYLNTPVLLYPKDITFKAYELVFTNSQLWSGFGITMILLIVGTTYQLFFTVITGYALSRDKWFGKNFVMNMIISILLFNNFFRFI